MSVQKIKSRGEKLPRLTSTTVFNRLWDAYVENGYTLPGPFSREGFSAFQRGDEKRGRDLDHECGYPQTITIKDYKKLYERGDLAANVVDSLPDECFISHPEVYETEDSKVSTPGEEKIAELLDDENTNFIHYLHRADKASRIGNFGGILLGLSDVGTRSTDFSDPVRGLSPRGIRTQGRPPKPNELLYLRCFDQSDITITKYDEDASSPRFGRPTHYQLKMFNPAVTGSISADFPSMDMDVHWTRFYHVADNRTSSEIFGRPAMQQVYNRLLDLSKILGGSAEMFWKGGFPGFAFETFPELSQTALLNKSALKNEMAAYQAGLQRFLSAVGGTWKSLAPQVADPTAHVLQQVLMVAAVLKMPLRVLMGSESGHLASTQDDTTWNRRVAGRCGLYLNPMVIKPFIRHLIRLGVIPPMNAVQVAWQDRNALSEKDRADITLKITQALLQYVSSGAEKVMRFDDWLLRVARWEPEEVQKVYDNAKNNKQLLTKILWDPNVISTGANGPGKNPTRSTGAGGNRNGLGGKAKKK